MSLLIVGLGNPGKKYQKTPHNAGTIAIEKFAEQKIPNNSFKEDIKRNAEYNFFLLNNTKIILAKPTLFMNESGKTVRSLMDFYKISPKNTLIIHDEADLPLGSVRMAYDRGAAGHNGVRSIIDHLSTQEFHRLRIGIQDNISKLPLETYVLKRLTDEQESLFSQGINLAQEEINTWIKKQMAL